MTKKLKQSIAIAMALVIFLGVSALGCISLLKALYPIDYENYVEYYAEQNNLDISFVYAVINCESSFDSDVVSSADAIGLMQITPDTFEWLQTKTGEELEIDDLYDPETNIKYGCLFYGLLLETFDSIETAIAGYHAGMNIVIDWLEDERYSDDSINLDEIPYPSTADYVDKVVFAQKLYQWLYDLD